MSINTSDAIFILDHIDDIDNLLNGLTHETCDLHLLATEIEAFFRKYYTFDPNEDPPCWIEVAEHVMCEYL